MANLVPTPIVDRNGKATTVHRRADPGAPKAGSPLARVRPSVAPAPGEPTTVVRPVRNPPHFDRISCLWPADEAELVRTGKGPYGWRRAPVQVPDSVLYGYLRLGLDLANASILHGAGITPEAAAKNEELDRHLAWRVYTLDGRYEPDFSERGRAIQLMEDHGVPAETAFKAMRNNLNDYSFTGGTGVLTVAEFATVHANLPFRESRRGLFAAIFRGDIPWELTATNTAGELQRLDREIGSPYVMWDEHGITPESDRETYIRGASVALRRMEKASQWGAVDHPVARMLTAYSLHGEEAFDVPQPDILLKQYRAADGAERYVDPAGARFAQAVLDLIGDRGDWGRGWLWQHSEGLRPHRLDAEALMLLRDAGATPEHAHYLLVEREMDAVQALAVVRDGVPLAVSEGAL